MVGKTLKFWNTLHIDGVTKYYVAAYSKAQAIRIATRAFNSSASEFSGYWSNCWSETVLDLVDPQGPGAWRSVDARPSTMCPHCDGTGRIMQPKTVDRVDVDVS